MANSREASPTPGAGVLRSRATRELATLFLKLGFTAFGGPAAHIALMRDEVVGRRRWLTETEFLDLLGATNLLPGPSSTQLALYIGFRRRGWAGLALAGVCFITPAAAIVAVCAWAYVRFGSLPGAEALLYGVKPVIIAIILRAMWGLLRVAAKDALHVALGVATLVLALLGVDVLVLIFGAGAVAGAVAWAKAGRQREGAASLFALLGATAAMIALPGALTGHGGAGAQPFSMGRLFSFFAKVGMTLYGGGYVLVAFLRDGLVHQWHWLTEAQLLDAVAVGQITPGPLFTTATFIGYLLGGPAGAAVATVGIFLPSFALVGLSGPLIPRLRGSRLAGAFLDGVNISALALMAAVTGQLGRAALVDPYTVGLAAGAGVVLFRFRVNSVWMMLAAGILGLVRYWVG